jgi:hypothetical protein
VPEWYVVAKKNQSLLFYAEFAQRIPKRIILYAKDVENITGKKARTASNLLQKIRVQNKKYTSKGIVASG